MSDQPQTSETPEQQQARLDATRPTSDPQHQSHAQHQARMQQPATQQAHALMLRLLDQSQLPEPPLNQELA